MSRVGKLPVKVPAGVTVKIADGQVAVKGKLGELSIGVPSLISVKLEGEEIFVTPQDDSKRARQLWGLTRSLVRNMVQGVTEGFTKRLEITGVGFRASVGKELTLQLGYSHDIKYAIPAGISIKAEKPTLLVISGADKKLVGQVASEIMKFRKVEPYKGKGIYEEGSYIRRKVGKKK